MTWPVGKLEQLLKIQELQGALDLVKAGRETVVLHAYFAPKQADWELAYVSQLGRTLPIPPGTKLCWYDMRLGLVKTFTPAWDRENGLASSGTIYAYSQRQTSDYFRFIGNLDVAGYFRGNEDNNPDVHFALDIGKRVAQRILTLEVYFQLTMPTAAVPNYLYLNYGDLVTQIDVSGVLYRQIEGGPSGSSASNSSSQTQPYRLASYGARSAVAGFEEEATVGRFRIFNPFGAREDDGRPSGFAQTTVVGWLFSPNTAYARTAGFGPTKGNVPYRQFMGVKIGNLNMDQYYRIFPTTSNVGADDNLARRGRGWVYAYFEEPIASLEEYE